MRALNAGDAVSLRLRSDPRYLCLVRALIRPFGTLAGFDEACIHRIALAVDEGCANIIRHSYGGRTDGEMEVSCELTLRQDGRRQMVIRLSDTGDAADFGRVNARERGDPLVPGGLGLHFMRDVMDTVEFRQEGEWNIVEMCLACPEPDAAHVPENP